MILPRRYGSAPRIDAWIDERIDLSVSDGDRERNCARARRSIVALLAAIGVASSRPDGRRALLAELEADDAAPPPL